MAEIDRPRVTLVHDWLTGMRGGEKCLEVACRRWPGASLFTLLHKRGSVSPEIESLRPRTSRIGKLPGVARYYRFLLPIFPAAARWPIRADSDLVLSFSHCVAKAAAPPAGVPHICYCFTPMRYAWHMRDAYFDTGRYGRVKAAVIDRTLKRLRDWDRATTDRVTHFIAISRTIRDRIRDCYGRPSTVIYPPVDTEFYTPAPGPREEYYLVVSALAPYKRFDLAIEACRKLGRKLVVIGSGQHAAKLKAFAGPGATFLGWQPDTVIRDHLRRAKALLFPGEEDFGIVPVEAQACGCPVIAFGRGGVTETVRPLGGSDPTGVFFEEQTADAVAAAVERFEQEADRFDPRIARRQAMPFRTQRYEDELFGFVDQVLAGPQVKTRWAA
jgi:glycosyltransferase involved in cell wall biosynthesis